MQLLDITRKLISCKSVTPHDDGAIDFLNELLQVANFKTHILSFDEGGIPIKNLYARFGTKAPNFCFAGHTDVVPPGDIDAWSSPPFDANIKDGYLIGRGIVDMKGGVAAFLHAAISFVREHKFEGSISFLITGDEEAEAINGTQKVLQWLAKKGEKIDVALVGEPTNPNILGEMIKNGRRGSINFSIKVTGIQGHVAYPKIADNPISNLIKILNELKGRELDKGNEYFEPSNLEIVNIEVNNPTYNVIPAQAAALLNIRYNNIHTANSLTDFVKSVCEKHAKDKYDLKIAASGEAFITEKGKFTDMLCQSIKEVTGLDAKLSTSGGTSDARFLKDYCEVIEFGLINNTAHKVDEAVAIEDIEKLRKIYYNLIMRYFKI